MVWRRNGKIDLRGEILERQEPSRLVYTFHVEGPGPVHDEGASIVTYDIVPQGETTKLVVTHGNFPKNSLSRKGVEGGWPAILSSLKSVLETGRMPKLTNWGEEEFKAAQEKQLREYAAARKQ